MRQKNDEFSRFKTIIGNFKNYLKAVPTEFQNFDLFYNEINKFEYNKFIQKSYKDEINNFDKRIIINELKLPSEKCFNDVIERAFNKKIPFNPEHGSSDKGFKDTLILESILENNLNNEEDIVILYSDDKGFEGIEKEFSNIKIAKTEEEAKKNKNQYKTVEKLLKEVMNA